MYIIARLSLAIIFFIPACLTQDNNFGFVPAALSDAIGSVQGAAATVHDLAETSNVETPVSTPQTFATTSTLPSSSPTTSTSTPTSTTSSTHSSKSSTVSTTKASSSTSSTSTSSSSTSSAASSTTSAAKASSTAAPQGQVSSAKIGVGVGVPLGIISIGLIGLLIWRHLRYKNESRLRHHGIIAAAGLYPVNEEGENNAGQTDHRNMTDAGSESDTQGLEKNNVHEIQGTEIPAYSRELIGSPGVPRGELGSRPGSL